ncbi:MULTISPECIES: cupredoxin domain-containing protein [unclassified Nocardioides]|uniref:cupredoxin domain-containing protein n=1 Tax=unclassified Nocardioides TaxID=2615069 RepID=UPI0006F97546|nr:MULTISPECIES: hypothetical protein [unclassified Nocardioides]KRA29917.1 hypothetical protein ASD81_19650 [Nocardioides sp. Root614]KRA86838.1 hypothetical protein ASD84_21865 [Nocardioides sp. Root682]
MTRAAAFLLALVLLAFGLTGCGDDKADSDSGAKDTPAASDQSDDAPDDAADDDGDDSTDDDSDDSADSAENPAEPVFTEGPGDATLSFASATLGEGEFDQSEITISVGQTVEFVNTGDQVGAVEVAGLDGVTISGGLKEYYRFDVAGTYSVEEDISGATAMIIVE